MTGFDSQRKTADIAGHQPLATHCLVMNIYCFLSLEWSGSPNGRPSAHSDPNFRRAADHGSFPSAHGSSRKDLFVESMPGTSCACDLHGFVEALECVERILSRKKAVTERDAGR